VHKGATLGRETFIYRERAVRTRAAFCHQRVRTACMRRPLRTLRSIQRCMIPITAFAGKRAAIFGLGSSGLASASALLAGGADVIAWDDDAEAVAKAHSAGVPTTDLRQLDWCKVSALVLAPGVPLTHPAPHWSVRLARAAAVEVIGDVELFCRERRNAAPDAPFVAITGTNGKSTTTALLAHMVRHSGREAEIGGNIGTAILSLLPPQRERVHVVEVSSYQIDLAPTLDPLIGILLNVTEDHLDRHGTLANYAAVKEHVITGVPPVGTAIVGVDDAWCAAAADRAEASGKKVLRVSVRRPLSHGLYVEAQTIIQAADGSARGVAQIAGIGSLRGIHNAQNAACATGAALALGMSAKEIERGLQTFPGLVHRMEQVGRIGRVLFVNDSKATNADSAAQALACFSDIFWIAGGRAKTGGIASLAGFFPRVRKAYLIGEAAAAFAAELEGNVDYAISGTLEQAVAAAARDARASASPEPVVLLSPACASFDQYRNFELRGDHFRALVRALPGLVPA
jgi:UDP-N-acetylmuramoylalanine--D-glutamate ligase